MNSFSLIILPISFSLSKAALSNSKVLIYLARSLISCMTNFSVQSSSATKFTIFSQRLKVPSTIALNSSTNPPAPCLIRYVTSTSTFSLFFRLLRSYLISFSRSSITCTICSNCSIQKDRLASYPILRMGMTSCLLLMMSRISFSDWDCSRRTFWKVEVTDEAAFFTNHILHYKAREDSIIGSSKRSFFQGLAALLFDHLAFGLRDQGNSLRLAQLDLRDEVLCLLSDPRQQEMPRILCQLLHDLVPYSDFHLVRPLLDPFELLLLGQQSLLLSPRELLLRLFLEQVRADHTLHLFLDLLLIQPPFSLEHPRLFQPFPGLLFGDEVGPGAAEEDVLLSGLEVTALATRGWLGEVGLLDLLRCMNLTYEFIRLGLVLLLSLMLQSGRTDTCNQCSDSLCFLSVPLSDLSIGMWGHLLSRRIAAKVSA